MGSIKLYCTILLIFCFQSFCWSQITPDDIQIWFEKSLESGSISITTNFLSEAEDLILLSYELSSGFEFKGEYQKIDFEKGEFLAAPNLPTPLSILTTGVKAKEKIILSLEIFQENKSIIQEKFVWMNDRSDTKETTIKKVEIQKGINDNKNTNLITNTIIDSLQNKIVEGSKKAQTKKRNTRAVDAIEIQGLIIDETRSKIGRDFYEIFFRKWIPPSGSNGDFIITIKELPAFGRSSRVSLEVNGQSLGNRNLSPRLEYVEQQVNSSIRQIRSYLTQRSNISKDLENEDTSGSGIF